MTAPNKFKAVASHDEIEDDYENIAELHFNVIGNDPLNLEESKETPGNTFHCNFE